VRSKSASYEAVSRQTGIPVFVFVFFSFCFVFVFFTVELHSFYISVRV